ncbi:MAG: dihydrodipicolinate synthase family protein [Rhodospirillaceae bacterium]
MSATNLELTGVYAAVLTPQFADGSPDHGRFAQHCKWLLANGCDGLGILGTTSEANSFSTAERLEIMDKLAESGVPTKTLMPGTGCCAVPDSVALTKKAVEIGATSVLMLPPFYYKNQTDEGLFAAFSEVIQKVGSDKLKINLYHFPQMSGVPVTMKLIEMLRQEYPKTVTGMKDSSGVLDNMVKAAKDFPGFCVFSGADDLMLPLLREGGAGCFTACANIASDLVKSVYSEYRANGDSAKIDAFQAPVERVRKIIAGYPLIPALKALIARHWNDAAWLNMRAPVVAMDDATTQRLFREYDGAGLRLPEAA